MKKMNKKNGLCVIVSQLGGWHLKKLEKREKNYKDKRRWQGGERIHRDSSHDPWSLGRSYFDLMIHSKFDFLDVLNACKYHLESKIFSNYYCFGLEISYYCIYLYFISGGPMKYQRPILALSCSL